MRLVDANELKHEIVGAIPMMATVRIPIEHKIDAAPTIDAIPVEWLNKQCEMADDRGDMEMTDTISWLIQTWQEKQEAR